ncbi:MULTISPECIES: pseudouridine synthase [unclassified Fibrobacter]|uniref:pseudouridine synthase n=1 Tax=unclassified Fibrobacter TaxID=2634177 RepID=UPI00091AF3E8|nr:MULTISPECIES: pseudouridine synthase [Fibrobacter]MCQ2101362.1 pseudouridine synthase [Fibrobacter sp.]MCL4101635.1 Ribosomal small subunit pseudouridine synthase A [Fibrobacter succinogenes]OWV01659.1 16S rRNA pseudouridine(516) synthase [Fibrobacter sp. UWH3]OWV06097.1 16S rRNA pseudouridine(516) synthase [Fibrobacter sp. UWH1]SHL86766.1 ribosomal small subunit pseudouridine synthase A [Fibrobacter sp. UWH6]
MPALTLERLVASIGFGSRKEARALIRAGMVEMDGEVVDDPFVEFKTRPETIVVNGEEIPTVEKLYIMMDKPLDVECSHNARDHQSIYSLLPDRFTAMGLQSVGRLDADSSGLILLSNQGDFIHKVESPKKGYLKKYRVTLAREFTAEQKAELLKGVMLKDERRPVLARELSEERIVIDGEEKDTVVISIGEGLYHQVRRMFAAVGNHVMTLSREAIGPVTMDGSLGSGGWRFMTEEEVTSLTK